MEKNNPPKWAMERVSEIVGSNKSATQTWMAFARYIAEHEEEPVDPLLLAARAICAVTAEEWDPDYDAAADYRSGKYDKAGEVQFALNVLKRAKEQS